VFYLPTLLLTLSALKLITHFDTGIGLHPIISKIEHLKDSACTAIWDESKYPRYQFHFFLPSEGAIRIAQEKVENYELSCISQHLSGSARTEGKVDMHLEYFILMTYHNAFLKPFKDIVR
jgi:hypothetical protein